MRLDKGNRLGSYEIEAAIGAGGMGEVYRARDTRLDRTVAIKVLAHLALHDGDLKQRFEREARVISSLNHPHICTLHDIGQHNGIDFLVMEYLEGESLASRLTAAPGERSRPLATENVLRHAIEIAEALSEAHRSGIVHRDLKPGNVMITRSGVKLLDFGLAKLEPRRAGLTVGVSTVSTLHHQPLTAEGTILGTWHYMAPEQLEGKDVDARTDIFAFGAVVYEMATGTKAFGGESHASVIAAILERDPQPISATRPMVSAALDRVIQKCLAKNPDARWQTARDLADELKWIADARPKPGHVSPDTATASSSRSYTWRLVAATAALAITGAAVGALVWNLPPRDNSIRPVRRFTVVPLPAAAMVGGYFALSPNGSHLVYPGRSERGSQLYLRALDQFEVLALPGTEDASNPAFSSDGQWVVFVSGGKLKKVSLTSNAAPITLADVPTCCAGQGMAWPPDDRIIVPLIATGLVHVPAHGGTPDALTKLDLERREIDHHSPSWLPGARTLLMSVHRGVEAFDVAVHRLDTGERRILVENAFEPRYVPTGHLVFVRDGTLFAAPFDADRVELTGAAVAVIENVQTFPHSGNAIYGVSDDGALAYVPAPSLQGRKLVWVDRRGTAEPLPIGPRGFGAPSLAPNGRRLAVHIDDGPRRDIWIYDLGADSLTRATFDGASAAPIWTPDGKRLVFSSTKDGRREIYWQPADGAGQPERLVGDDHSVWAGNWSPDQRTLAYTRQPPTDRNDIGLLRLGERPTTGLVVSSTALEQWPRISPDGKWLAYAAAEQDLDVPEVYVIGLSGAGGKRQVSIDGGSRPVWSRDGRELFYLRGTQFMVASVGSLPGGVGKPQPLPVSVRAALSAGGDLYGPAGYDVSLDGQRLLIVQEAEEESAPPQIHVGPNWFEELKRRVPIR